MFTGATISFLFVVLFKEVVSVQAVMTAGMPILYTGLISLGLANMIQFFAQRKASPSVSAIILSFESVFGAIFGSILLSERMSLLETVGCAFIFAAVLVAQFDQTRNGSKQALRTK